jgi:hypothetical protein
LVTEVCSTEVSHHESNGSGHRARTCSIPSDLSPEPVNLGLAQSPGTSTQ